METKNIFGESESPASVKERLSVYTKNWPLFIVCMLIFAGAGALYSRYTIPKYMAITSLLVKGGEGGNAGSGDLIETALSGKREINLNNEIMLLGSASLMQRTISKNGFNVYYLKKGRLLDIDVYNDVPFRFLVTEMGDSNATYTIHLNNINSTGGKFTYGLEKTAKSYDFQWGVPFILSGQHFVLVSKKTIKPDGADYIVTWKPVKTVADELSKELLIKAFDTKTSVIQLSLKTENLQKGKDILNALFKEFYSSDIEDRSRLSENTVQFIDDRLLLISGELKGVEGNLENYQGNNQLVDLKGQSTQGLENSNTTLKAIKELAIQQGIVEMILNYFANPVNNGKLVPSALGLSDGTLASLITQYNDLQLKREREAPLVAPNSTVMQDLNNQLGSLKSSILESLNNISKNLKLQENNFQQQNSQNKSFLSSVPHNERVLQEIKRKQGITEGLYLYLLQKREEAAISSTASKVAHYKQIDLATGFGPVEPNSRNIFMYTALLGFILALAFIHLRELLNDKITNKSEILKKISVPVIGEINHVPKKIKQPVLVSERGLISEQFRSLRTSLSYLLKKNQEKTILITSSVSSEGKSFVSLNLAAVFAIVGKKVALLEFDTRNPVIASNLNIEVRQGLTNYLNGEMTEISEAICTIEEIPTLHIFPCGPLPKNSADLLHSDRMSCLFQSLTSAYDYIIIDSPPAGLVSDPIILSKFSHSILYVIRQGVTSKKNLDFFNQNFSGKTSNNLFVVLNDVATGDKNEYGKYYVS